MPYYVTLTEGEEGWKVRLGTVVDAKGFCIDDLMLLSAFCQAFWIQRCIRLGLQFQGEENRGSKIAITED